MRSEHGAFATSRTLANVVTMNERLQERLHARLQRIRRENRWKDRRVFSSGPGARIRTAQGRELLLFTSNDYLGLARDARVTAAGKSAAGQYGAGTVAGGFVAGPEPVTALLEQTARAMLFTTALTPCAAASSCEAVRILKSEPTIVRELQGKVKYFVEELAELLPSQTPAQSAIVPLIVGDSAKAQVVAHALEEEGIFASCFSYPAVPEGQARLRFQVSRAHGFGELSYCAAACRRILAG